MLLPDPTDRTQVRRPIVVQKYGGSSVADVEKLVRVADRVVATRRAGNDVVVVVSAMGKTTDQLLALAAQVAAAAAPAGAVEPPRRELDMLVSTGERVAMSLLSIAIQARGLDAISFTGSQSGILTNDRHFDARIVEVRPHRIEDELARGRVVIVAGYQGMSYKREITTLGRGGSDTTAVALAAALEAVRCEIYSDVDGVYSADPRQVPDARHLPELDYATLQELAESGAKVLCAQAVEWARRAGITLHARKSFDEPGAARETVVRATASETTRARAVSADDSIAWLSLTGADRSEPLLEVVRRRELPCSELAVEPRDVRLIVPRRNVPEWPLLRGELESAAASCGGALSIEEDVGLVSVVGGGLADRGEPLARFRSALASAGAEPTWLGATALRLSAVIARAHLGASQRALHAQFVTSE